MQRPMLRELFRDLVIKARDTSLWEKATPVQIQSVVSRNLLRHFCTNEHLEMPCTAGNKQSADN